MAEELFAKRALGLRVSRWGDRRRYATLPEWSQVFVALAKIHREYWDQSEDLGWWSSERASVSLFSNAVWRAGGVSLQEYGDLKHEEEPGDATVSGRPDLYVCMDESEFVVEAKIGWPNLAGAARDQRIEGSLAAAIADAKRNPVKDEETGAVMRRAAFSFVTPRLNVARLASVDARLKKLLADPFDGALRAAWNAGAPVGFRVDVYPIARGGWLAVENCGWGNFLYPGFTLLVAFLQ